MRVVDPTLRNLQKQVVSHAAAQVDPYQRSLHGHLVTQELAAPTSNGKPTDYENRPDQVDVTAVINALTQLQNTAPRRTPYKSFVKLNVAGTNTLAMVDSGNLVVNAMSSHFAPYLTPLKCKIGTAQKGASMQLLGVIREPLTLRFGRGTKSYLSRPLVFEGLNSDFNLAGPFSE